MDKHHALKKSLGQFLKDVQTLWSIADANQGKQNGSGEVPHFDASQKIENEDLKTLLKATEKTNATMSAC